ncbi:MAG: substrate-binding domain-containing protein, partial [Synergistaceae bacterium]|nr:substrate-binding domain-containing protein [Synergistaceae bacterium]
YPLYGAIALSIYKGLDGQTAGDYVVCTSIGYERLSDGEIDIFFGARPSKAQVETAAAKSVEFRLMPIGREAFVFFVNSDNPVDNLSVEQIRDIYRKKISNWRAVGGRNKRIMPFQRPEDSGSQAVMTIRVMEGEKLPTPLIEEHSGTILSSGPRYSVAEYRNYSSAIGYSFRFFAGGKKPNDNIKLIAIDGVEPTPANIRNGRYPFTADIYAVTTGDESANTRKLIDWILSEQGQNFVEQCGYVRR